MRKTKIGLIILVSVTLAGLVLSGVVMAKSPFSVKGSDKTKYVPDEIVIKFKGDIKPFRVIKVPKGRVGEKVREYLRRKDVEYAEPNYIAYTLMVPNDPYYSYQWHMDNPVYGGIQTEETWDISTGSGIIVAIVDTGIAYENYRESWWRRYYQAPDLAETCFVSGYDFVNNDNHPNDDNSHGTHVAGTVAQSTNNNLGVAGVAFDSCLMPVKVLNKYGSGTYADVAGGIYFAVDNGAQVINLSLGGSEPSTTLEDAVAYAYENGVTVIAAAGNENSTSIAYPAAYDDYVIAVGATRYDETLAYYSNYGPSLDLVAPGGDLNVDQNNDGYGDGVLQNTFNPNTKNTSDFGYWFFQGTSMSAPHVSGVAALVIANGNASTPEEVRAALQETAEDLGEEGWDETYGWGLIDAYATLQWTTGPACTGDADCDDSNECTTDVCVNPGTAEAYCENTPVADDTTCTGGICCSGECIIPTCTETGSECDDANECTIDTCNSPGTCPASCSWTNVADNTECTGGICCAGTCTVPSCSADVDCDDNNACTIDTCNYGGTCDASCSYEAITTCINDDGCCPAGCDYTTDNDCPEVPTVMCWSGTNEYLYRNRNQMKKFCKCAEGTYGYKSYSYTWGRKIVYQYVDSGDNENWEVTSRSSYLPVYQVKCTDGVNYPTSQDYYYGQ